jgi:hypothetical protein
MLQLLPALRLLRYSDLKNALVRIQTQLSDAPTVDGLVLAGASGNGRDWEEENSRRRRRRSAAWKARGEQSDAAEPHDPSFVPRWLTPDDADIQIGDHHTLQLTVGDQVNAGVFAVWALPASYPRQFISLRVADLDGQDHEVGLVRDLDDWPGEVQELLERALRRRYFLRRIKAIEHIDLKYGLLSFRAETDQGPVRFVMRNSHSQAQDYGAAGKVLIDVDENRYVVPDVDALSRRQQLLFRRYIYW